MGRADRGVGLASVVSRNPLQAGKLGGILGTLVVSLAGAGRVIDAEPFISDAILADGRFLVVVLVPVLGVGLVGVVALETLAAGYRWLRADASIVDGIANRPGYALVRGVEAAVAVAGVAVLTALLVTLVVASVPAPAGVAMMLLLLAVGIAIVCASCVRTTVELVGDTHRS